MFVRGEILEAFFHVMCASVQKAQNRIERFNCGKQSMLAIAVGVGNQPMGHHHLMFPESKKNHIGRERLATS